MMADRTVTPQAPVPGTGSAAVDTVARDRAGRRGRDARKTRPRPETPVTENDDEETPPPRVPGRLDVLA